MPRRRTEQGNSRGKEAGTTWTDFYDDSFFDDEDESQLSKKELKKREKERKRLEKERAKEAKILAKRDSDFDNVASDDVDEGEKSGGKGRLALKIVLIVLIVILAAEVVGMGIRVPGSAERSGGIYRQSAQQGDTAHNRR